MSPKSLLSFVNHILFRALKWRKWPTMLSALYVQYACLCVCMCVSARQRRGEKKKSRSKKSMWLTRLLFLLFLNDYEQIWEGKKKKTKAGNDSELFSFFSWSLDNPSMCHTSQAHSIIHSCQNIRVYFGTTFEGTRSTNSSSLPTTKLQRLNDNLCV